MFFKIAKILLFFLIIFVLTTVCIFFVNPHSLVYLYVGEDNKTIVAETKYIPIKKIVARANFEISPDAEWSPNDGYFSYFDFVRLEFAKKEWALKIINTRTLVVKTIFIGDFRVSEYDWLNDGTIRVYVSAGSGVRVYRDININVSQPIIMIDDWESGAWVPEKTF